MWRIQAPSPRLGTPHRGRAPPPLDLTTHSTWAPHRLGLVEGLAASFEAFLGPTLRLRWNSGNDSCSAWPSSAWPSWVSLASLFAHSFRYCHRAARCALSLSSLEKRESTTTVLLHWADCQSVVNRANHWAKLKKDRCTWIKIMTRWSLFKFGQMKKRLGLE